jgi:hypothetical protein
MHTDNTLASPSEYTVWLSCLKQLYQTVHPRRMPRGWGMRGFSSSWQHCASILGDGSIVREQEAGAAMCIHTYGITHARMEIR